MSLFYGSSPDAETRNALTRGSLKTISRPEGVYTVDGAGNIVNFQPYDQGGTGGSTSGVPTWAQQQSVAQNNAQLTEQQRQYNETFGANKARGDQQQQLAQAQLAWQQAVDARDFTAAEHWKQVSASLAQNQFALDYQKNLQSMSGPQDYVKYWYASRGMTTPKGAESVPYEQAVPSWAQPVTSGSQTGALGQATQVSPAAAAPSPAVPTWAQGSVSSMPRPLPTAPWADVGNPGTYRESFNANVQAPVRMSAAVAAGQSQYTPELLAQIKQNNPTWAGPYSAGA